MKVRPKTIFVTSKIKGLTFIEVLFVIIIVGILIAVALPNSRKAFNSLQLNSTCGQLQSFMNYLREQAIIEGKVVYLNIDSDKKEYWAQIKDAQARLKTYPLPQEIEIETEQQQILFYPDGHIDNVTLKLTNRNKQSVVLTTKGMYGKVKLQTQE